jgi:hypothetical protein
VSHLVDCHARCGCCGLELSESVELPSAARSPCPSCGSLSRNIAFTKNEAVKASSHVTMLQERQGQAIGFSESERQGRASDSTLDSNGSLRLSIQGSSPQGEEDTPTACRVLLDRLKEDGVLYDTVTRGPEPADCILTEGSNPDNALGVQVVHAIVSEDLWETLGKERAAQVESRLPDVVRQLRAAIEHNGVRKLGPRERADLVLALDATRLPGLGFDAVIREFRAVEAAWAASLGFRAIWLVGPTPRLTWRLDRP